MYEDAATSHLVLLDSVGNGYLVLGNQPHITVDASMIGEVQRHLFLAGGVGLVVAVVGFDGDDNIVAYGTVGGKIQGDG